MPKTHIPCVLIVLAFSLALGATVSGAADRHVYLDTNGNGQLNDCPNPAHNAKGTSNTDELSYCASSGSQNGKVVGTAPGRVSAAACAADAQGAVRPLTSGSFADIDGDGSREFVYGHPQACVWNMAKSDSCEVHAGTYRNAGAQCDENCGNQSQAGLEGTLGVCDKFDCFKASVVAFGDGPNLDGTGYGTAAAPGWLRAANVNGSIDSWDPNGDKDPSDGVFPAIISGDSDRNGAFDRTTCSGGSCSGDAFYAVMIGCGGPMYGRHFCRTAPEAGTTYVRIDSDGDGTIDHNVGVFGVSTKEVHNLRVKDLVFTRYNGGNGAIDGTRPHTGTIDLNGGDGSTDGLVVDHIRLYGNDFTNGLDNVSTDRVENEGYTENHWAAFNDQTNAGCTTPTVIENSLLVQNNARLLNFDCGANITCGCEVYFHDNRVIVDVDPAKVPTYTDTAGAARTRSIVVGYYKNIDVNPAQHRIWNNEFLVKSMGTSRAYFMDLQAFGNAQGQNHGSLWIYGNLFRNDATATVRMKRFWQGYCDIASGGYELYFFNNSFDMDTEIGPVCSGSSGDLVAEKNNAFLRATSLYQSTAATLRRTNNLASTNASDRAVWWSPGAYATGAPGDNGGAANYTPRGAGVLDGTGSCDPDGDGLPGVDYDGDGIRDTTWRDLAGRTVSCPSLTATMDIGAVQSAAAGPVCGNGVREGTEACDGPDLASQTCLTQGRGAGTLACSASCTFNLSGCGTIDNTPPGTVQGLHRNDTKP